MINKFKKIMGTPETTNVAIGDYSGNNMKGFISTITKKWRIIFKRHGYEVYLINEYNTSKINSCCEGLTENCIERQHKNNEKEGKRKSYVWKLVRCTICKSIHNRDNNASKNMMEIIEKRLKNKKRPKKFMPLKETKAESKKRRIIEI